MSKQKLDSYDYTLLSGLVFCQISRLKANRAARELAEPRMIPYWENLLQRLDAIKEREKDNA